MSSDRQQPGPWWQPSSIDIGRRSVLLGLSAIVMSAMGSPLCADT